MHGQMWDPNYQMMMGHMGMGMPSQEMMMAAAASMNPGLMMGNPNMHQFMQAQSPYM
jgi:hypothetical protein